MSKLLLCEFRPCVNMLGQECMRCFRVIRESTIRNNEVVMFPMECHIPSMYDFVAPLSEFEISIGVRYNYTVPFSKELLTNELIGQEGGRWDHLYMEG